MELQDSKSLVMGLASHTEAALRRWEEGEGPRRSWYKPVEDSGPLGRAVRFVLGNPQLFLISSSDTSLLPLILEAAEKALGEKFNVQRFHDFILAQGLLPPGLLRKAVIENFVPKQ